MGDKKKILEQLKKILKTESIEPEIPLRERLKGKGNEKQLRILKVLEKELFEEKLATSMITMVSGHHDQKSYVASSCIAGSPHGLSSLLYGLMQEDEDFAKIMMVVVKTYIDLN